MNKTLSIEKQIGARMGSMFDLFGAPCYDQGTCGNVRITASHNVILRGLTPKGRSAFPRYEGEGSHVQSTLGGQFFLNTSCLMSVYGTHQAQSEKGLLL